MPKLSEGSRQRRRESIAAAAMRCFARQGFASTSMADIISEAGSSAGSVYSHFPSKAALLRFAASAALSEVVAALSDELPSERTPASVLAHLLRSRSDRVHAQTLLQIWAEGPRDGELEEIARDSVNELRALVRTALLPWCQEPARARTRPPDTAADEISDAVITAVQGYVVRVSIDRDLDSELVASRLIAVFEKF
ncbi:TetR/AcrR family transcriptional regulator [Corallococcus llansteffanensis]|uniref:TetR/AcrR family transcriptional regulator n=1 Tax=Corallococcus llansteffanensis TaxID=2316731 RepID=A0A3A8QJ32_9BACT|nr:TetR/AcrR family transcriptional regulator [Corallococcus llansteffanensis]RKH68759.1 TetR/AcrR family transcriptional regulator [Corallococcus llansteffanensis]